MEMAGRSAQWNPVVVVNNQSVHEAVLLLWTGNPRQQNNSSSDWWSGWSTSSPSTSSAASTATGALSTPTAPTGLWNSSQQVDLFWTPYHRYLLKQVPWQLHATLGVLVACIGLFGIIANSVVLYVFSRFKRLRTPANVFIMNLTLSDLCACLLHPLASYSSFNGGWAFGRIGCNLYGMGVGFFGLNSIITLMAIACERYIVITAKPAAAKWRITRRQAKKICVGIWIHCSILVVPPLFGWSAYVPEGLLTTCSWDYTTRTASNRLYYIFLLVFGFVIPVAVITASYLAIFRFIWSHTREMTHLTAQSLKSSFRKNRKKTDVRTAQIILTLALVFFLAWTPYSVVSLIGQFGPADSLTPLATAVPAYFAKTAVLFDPIVYGFSHPHFRTSMKQLFHSISQNSTVRIAVPLDMPHDRTHSQSRLTCSRGRQSSSRRLHHSSRRRQIDEILVHRKESPPDGKVYHHRRLSSPHPASIQPRLHAEPENVLNEALTASRSEPDLLRCDRIIRDAYKLSFDEYRRQRKQFIWKVFFSSDNQLNPADAVPEKAVTERPKFGVRRESRASCSSRISSRCTSRITRSRRTSRSSLGDQRSICSRDFVVAPALSQLVSSNPLNLQMKKGRCHRNCCECAHAHLSNTVTLANVPSRKGKGPSTRRWEVCMISNMDSLSNSLNSP